MKRISVILLAAVLAFAGCKNEEGPWGDPGTISDISSEGLEKGVKISFTAPVDHKDYYYTQISYTDSEGATKNLRVARFDADASGHTDAEILGLDEGVEYSFTAQPYSYGGVGGNTLTTSCAPLSIAEIGYLTFSVNTASTNITVKKTDDFEYHVESTGLDPNVQTEPLKKAIRGKKLTYDYKAVGVSSGLQLFFICAGQPVTTWAKQSTAYFPAALANASEWTYFELDLSEYIEKYNWGKPGDALRFDFGNASGATIDIRNMLFK